MSRNDEWKQIVASSLDWEEAHASFEKAVNGVPPLLRASKPAGLPHSVWDIVEHIRIAQRDLLDFCTNPDYQHNLDWPADYWPKDTDSVSNEEWDASIAQFFADRASLKEFAVGAHGGPDLWEKIPWGTGQTFLRTILVSVDHTSYHTAEIITLRRLIGAWPGS